MIEALQNLHGLAKFVGRLGATGSHGRGDVDGFACGDFGQRDTLFRCVLLREFRVTQRQALLHGLLYDSQPVRDAAFAPDAAADGR